jgi:hypothetical protein
MRAASLWLLLILTLPAALGAQFGCGTPTFVVQHYPGPARAAHAVAIVRVDGNRGVQLLSLDGEATDVRVTPDSRLHIEILPGNHTLWVVSLAAPESPAQSVAFRAQPGKIYRVEFVNAGAVGADTPRVYEVERNSNVLGADVTLAETSSATVPPTRPATPPATPPAPVPEELAPASPPSGNIESQPADDASRPEAAEGEIKPADAGVPER